MNGFIFRSYCFHMKERLFHNSYEYTFSWCPFCRLVTLQTKYSYENNILLS